MFDLTVLDYVFVGVVILSTIWATIRGGIYEMVATMSWVAAAIAARFASPWLDKLLQSLFGLSDSTVGTLVASYFLVFFVILILVGFFNQKLREKIQASILKVTDRTLGVIFGIIRGIVVMGIVYLAALWYYSDATLPQWIEQARTRPIMQLTALKLDEWFIPGDENKLILRDMSGTRQALEIYQNLINPAVVDNVQNVATPSVPASGNPADATESAPETGYKSSERTALENQLLQIETDARAQEQRELQNTQDTEIIIYE